MNPKSHTLFHFTKSRENLKKIIKEGFWPRYCLEDLQWLGYEKFPFVAYPMVCFCDIPLSRIQEHVDFYGNFGLGLTKEWALANGLNPILYMASENSLTKEFVNLNAHANKLSGQEQANAKVTMRYILGFAKPSEGIMVVNDTTVNKEFYQESEWRYIPKDKKILQYMIHENFKNSEALDSANLSTKNYCSLKFTPKDIKYIFVKEDADIPDVMNFIHSGLDAFPSSDLKVLMSRVTSLESLARDL